MSEIIPIDANALKEDLRHYFTEGVLDGISAKLAFNQILHDIDNAPTVHHPNCDICEDKAKQYSMGFQDGFLVGKQRPQGEWIVDEDDDILKPLKCSNCGEVAECLDGGSQFLSNYCPNCGADMRGGAE